MNAATKSLSSYELSFQNPASRAQVSGAYTGTATSLTFKTTAAADLTPGETQVISFDVLDQKWEDLTKAALKAYSR